MRSKDKVLVKYPEAIAVKEVGSVLKHSRRTG